MKKKIISFFLVAATVTSIGLLSNNMVAKADNVQEIHQKQANGWVESNGIWKYYQNGSSLKGWQVINGHWYYLNNDGIMQTGWQNINGHWYYLNPNGDMATGWKLVNGHWYYLSGSGAMLTGWINLGDTWYFLNDSGEMQTGWLSEGGSWYYLYGSGAMATGQVNIDGKLQNFNSNGVWTGQVTADINAPMWIAGNGSNIYHDSPKCSNMRKPLKITLGEARKKNLRACYKCKPAR